MKKLVEEEVHRSPKTNGSHLLLLWRKDGCLARFWEDQPTQKFSDRHHIDFMSRFHMITFLNVYNQEAFSNPNMTKRITKIGSQSLSTPTKWTHPSQVLLWQVVVNYPSIQDEHHWTWLWGGFGQTNATQRIFGECINDV